LDVPFKAKLLTVTPDEHDELRQMSLSRSLPAGDVIRARMILMLAAFPPDNSGGTTPLSWNGRFSEIPAALIVRLRRTT
jgi:hypothetical protein